MTDRVSDGVPERTIALPAARPGRLSRSADVQRALRRGRSRAGTLLAVHVLPRPAAEASDGLPDPTGARLTVVASRRVGGAVRRNRAKRLLREAARTLAWREGVDVVLVARAACAASDLHRVSDELGRLSAQLDAVSSSTSSSTVSSSTVRP